MPPTSGAKAKILAYLKDVPAGTVLTREEIARRAGLSQDTVRNSMRDVARVFPITALAQGRVWQLGPARVAAAPQPSSPVASPEPVAAEPLPLPEPVPAAPDGRRPDGTFVPGRAHPRLGGMRKSALRGTVIERYSDTAMTFKDADGYLWSARRIGLAEE